MVAKIGYKNHNSFIQNENQYWGSTIGIAFLPQRVISAVSFTHFKIYVMQCSLMEDVL